MSRNGSGVYSLPSGNPVTSGTAISSTVHNNTLSDIATALTASIANDGQTVPVANLPMGGFKHTGCADGSAVGDSATVKQVQNSFGQQLTSVSGTNTIVGTATPAPAAYAAGQRFSFVSAGANTGAATLNVSSLGAKSVTMRGTTALAAGDIVSGALVIVEYDGTQFQIINPATLLLSGGTVAGALTVSGTLAVTGAATLSSTLAVTGALTPTGGIAGVANNGSPTAGQVGEVISSAVAIGSAVALTTNVVANVTSITLTPGDWNVCGCVLFTYGATTNITQVQGSTSDTTAALDSDERFSLTYPSGIVPGTLVPLGGATPTREVKVAQSTTATVYLVAQSVFTVSTCSAYGKIWARRAR